MPAGPGRVRGPRLRIRIRTHSTPARARDSPAHPKTATIRTWGEAAMLKTVIQLILLVSAVAGLL
jgi:hypothetical protein